MKEIKHLSVHQWLRSAIPDSQQPNSPIGFLFLKLRPPRCAVLLVYVCMCAYICVCIFYMYAAILCILIPVFACFLNGMLARLSVCIHHDVLL